MPLNIGFTGLNFCLRSLHGTFSAQMGVGVGVILKCVLIEMFHESVDDTELIQLGLTGGLWSKRLCSISNLCLEIVH
jgi:hypothetical protein